MRKMSRSPDKIYRQAREKRTQIIEFMNKEQVIGKEFFVKFRAGRAASNIQKSVPTKTERNNLPGRFDESDKEENMGFDVLIIRRKDNFKLPFVIDCNMSPSRFNTYYRKPHSLPKKQVITKNECIPYFDVHFLFFHGIDANNLKRYFLISGKQVWDIGRNYWGKLVWIPSAKKWSLDRNMIQFDLKQILKLNHEHITWKPIFDQKKEGFHLTKSSPTFLQAIKEVFKRESKIKK